MQAPGLYIHIPFCKTKCGYCDFYSCTDTGLAGDFLASLLKEADLYRGEFTQFDTVYLGGGTPSLLSMQAIEKILEKVRRSFRVADSAEVTMEINPVDLEQTDYGILKNLGVNRINIGVQSFDDRELKFLGRRHDSRQAAIAIEWAIEAGYHNVGFDLIYNLPGQDMGTWQESLSRALEFAPGHLSCYELELKPDTPLGLSFEKGELGTRSEARMREFFMRTSEFLEKSGYTHYEVSNFARGFWMASQHNQKYWDHTPYLGLGPSAHSFKGSRRWWNHGSLEAWLHALDEGMKPVGGHEELRDEELAFEALFLGLRMKKGIDCTEYRRRYGIDLMQEKGAQLDEWVRTGLVEIKGSVIRPTRAGMAVADALVLL